MKKATLALLFCLLACPVFSEDPPPPPASPSDLTPSSNRVYLDVGNGHKIEGDLVELESIQVYASFGEAKFPISELSAVKFHADDTDAAVFSFKNGDLITAHVKISNIKVDTAWGSADVRVPKLSSIKINKTGEFYQDTTASGKKRWRFGETQVIASSQTDSAR